MSGKRRAEEGGGAWAGAATSKVTIIIPTVATHKKDISPALSP